MPDNQQTSDKQVTEIDNYHKIEIQEIFTSIRTVNTLRIQVYSFFGTANVTIIGVALGAKNAGLILLAASIIGVLILADRRMRRYYSVLLSRGLELEDMYALDKEIAILHKFVTQSSFSKKGWIRRYRPLLLVLIIEIAMAILSWSLLNWSWF